VAYESQWHLSDDGRPNPHSSAEAYSQGATVEDWDSWETQMDIVDGLAYAEALEALEAARDDDSEGDEL
jgi:hypothetical protein